MIEFIIESINTITLTQAIQQLYTKVTTIFYYIKKNFLNNFII